VQDASHHVLVSDLFVLRPTPHDYLQPMVAISGGLAALGLAPWLALLIWKPVALMAIFLAVRAYARRALPTRGQQLAGMTLAIFAASYGVLGDEWIPFMSWGYLFGLVAVAAAIGALLAYDRAHRNGEVSWLAPALALLASWLHPWQGELLILVVVGSELLIQGKPSDKARPIRLPAATVAAAALPLLYYAVLDQIDPAWGFAASLSQRQWSLAAVLLPLIPLLVASAAAYRTRPTSFLGAATRLWPLGALCVWGLALGGLGAGPLHAWTGITIPLAMLAVEGVQTAGLGRLPRHRLIGVLVVAALTIPGTIAMMRATTGYLAPARDNQNLISSSEQRAFSYIAKDPQPGGVLSSYMLGDAVPAETGRHTYLGDYRWSGPGYRMRERMTWDALHGWIRGSTARRFLLGTGARFVLADCRSHANLKQDLAPTPVSVDRFGCVTVYEVK
jgi:MFS family permease